MKLKNSESTVVIILDGVDNFTEFDSVVLLMA